MRKADERCNRHITISAAGQGSRISAWMIESEGYRPGMPKSSLRTAQNESLMGRVVRQAIEVGDIRIVANYKSIEFIGKDPDLPRDVILEINRNITGPLGPIYLDVLKTKKQSYMVAGDIWAEFRWSDFIDFHNSHGNPVSILLAKSTPVNKGAIFIVNAAGSVLSWKRVKRTAEADYINIGAYIIDGHNAKIRQMVANLNAMTHMESAFNDAMIQAGFMSAYCLDCPAFNINESETYMAMLEHSKNKPRVSEPESLETIIFIKGAP